MYLSIYEILPFPITYLEIGYDYLQCSVCSIMSISYPSGVKFLKQIFSINLFWKALERKIENWFKSSNPNSNNLFLHKMFFWDSNWIQDYFLKKCSIHFEVRALCVCVYTLFSDGGIVSQNCKISPKRWRPSDMRSSISNVRNWPCPCPG